MPPDLTWLIVIKTGSLTPVPDQAPRRTGCNMPGRARGVFAAGKDPRAARGWEGPGRKNPAIFRELPGKRPAIVPEGLVHTRRAWPGACAARLDLPRPSPSPVCLISGSPPFRPGKPAIREFPAVSLTGYGGLAPAIVGTAGKLTRRIDCFDECGKKVPDLGKEFKKISAAHGSSPIDFSLTLLIQNIQCFLAVKVFERH